MSQIKDGMIPYLKADEIDEIVSKIAKEIEKDYRGQAIVLIGVLKGSLPFIADLSRKLNLAQRIDFVSLSSQKNRESDYIITINQDISTQLSGKHVLIVEEIIDAGRKLSFLKNRILASGPASLKIVTLLDKPARRVINIKADYIGKTIEDRYVVGYGLDDGELGRNYPDIYYLRH
jgi:hypoxanthine phosphoribosyltransferase